MGKNILMKISILAIAALMVITFMPSLSFAGNTAKTSSATTVSTVEELQTAINNDKTGATIKLKAEMDMDNFQITVPADSNVVLDLNHSNCYVGESSGSGVSKAPNITNFGTLVLYGDEGGNKLSQLNTNVDGQPVILNEAGATMTIDSVSLSNYSGPVMVNNGAMTLREMDVTGAIQGSTSSTCKIQSGDFSVLPVQYLTEASSVEYNSKYLQYNVFECDKDSSIDKDVAVGSKEALGLKVDTASGATVAYTSEDTSIATVDGSGNVTGVAVGATRVKAAVTVKDMSYSVFFPVYVNPKSGTKYTVDGIVYKVTSPDHKMGSVSVVGPADKNITSAVIPASIKIGDFSYAIEEMSGGAFQNCKKLKNVEIYDCRYGGKNAFRGCTGLNTVTFYEFYIIGKYSFYGDKNLKKINISVNIGSDWPHPYTSSFKGINKHVKIDVPNKYIKYFKKYFKKCGGPSTAKVY